VQLHTTGSGAISPAKACSGNNNARLVGHFTGGDPQRYRDPSWFVEAAEVMCTAHMAHKDDNDFIQASTLYRQLMSPTVQDHLVGNIVRHLGQGWTLLPGARGENLLVPVDLPPIRERE
jgi:hypothetical protein